MSYRVIKGDKIKRLRGERSLREVADATGGAFSHGALHQWEIGEYQPTMDKLPALLKALNCTYDDISEPVELGVPA